MTKTATLLPPEVLALYDEYTQAPLDRRTFLDRLAKLAGGTAAAMALLPILGKARTAEGNRKVP